MYSEDEEQLLSSAFFDDFTATIATKDFENIFKNVLNNSEYCIQLINDSSFDSKFIEDLLITYECPISMRDKFLKSLQLISTINSLFSGNNDNTNIKEVIKLYNANFSTYDITANIARTLLSIITQHSFSLDNDDELNLVSLIEKLFSCPEKIEFEEAQDCEFIDYSVETPPDTTKNDKGKEKVKVKEIENDNADNSDHFITSEDSGSATNTNEETDKEHLEVVSIQQKPIYSSSNSSLSQSLYTLYGGQASDESDEKELEYPRNTMTNSHNQSK